AEGEFTTAWASTIPYADALAEAYEATPIRSRRDFDQLLVLIKTHAIIHQLHRERDQYGRIVAEYDDYDGVRELMVDVFESAVSDGLTTSQRDAVQMVEKLVESDNDRVETGVTTRELAEELNISKQATHKRVQIPLAEGYLVNIETRKGRPIRLKPGDPLPEVRSPLPDPEQVVGLDDSGSDDVVTGRVEGWNGPSEDGRVDGASNSPNTSEQVPSTGLTLTVSPRLTHLENVPIASPLVTVNSDEDEWEEGVI
ncbi:MAG: hypothetical protein ABEL51_03735, partial [Salinibacter sp.]